jgi:DUF4097 and DUF4098 domain-containing protein YvlB
MSIQGYRRGSIFWALVLIAVGAIFLYHNFNPAIHPWEIIAKFWPILIIFWGLSKLVDHLQAQAHPDKVAPPLFSGSEVILLLLILLLGTLISKIVLRSWHRWPAELGIETGDEEISNLFLDTFTYTQTISRAAKPQPRLIVEDQHGDLEIHPTDQSSIELMAKKVIRAESESEAKKLADGLKIEILEEGGRYQLRSNRRSLPDGGSHVRLDLVLRVPKATSAEITSERGDIVLDGLRGDQTLTARNGDVRVSSTEGLLRIHKTGGLTEVSGVKGNVELDGRGNDVEIANVAGTVTVSGDFSGSMQFRNVTQTLRYTSSRTDLTLQRLAGRLSMDLGSLEARGVDGPFELSTRQKDITLEEFRHNVKITNTNGAIQLRTSVAPSHSIEVDSKKGDIDLTLPETAAFQIEASSRQGEAESDFSGPNLKVQRQGEAPSITGSYGKGGPTIRLTTAYGTIHLTRQMARSPAAPAPPAHPAPPRHPAEGEDET